MNENRIFLSKFRQALSKFEVKKQNTPLPKRKYTKKANKIPSLPKKVTRPVQVHPECPETYPGTVLKINPQDNPVPFRQECPNSDHPSHIKPPKCDRKNPEVCVDTHEGGSKKSTTITSDKLLPGNVVPHPQAEHLPETKHLHNPPTPTPVLPKAENLTCYQSNTGGPYGLPGEKIRYVGINLPTGTSLRNVDQWSWLKEHPKVSTPTAKHQPKQNLLPGKVTPPGTVTTNKTSKLLGKDDPQVGMSNVEKLKLKLKMKMSDTNAKPSLPPPRRQHAAPMEDNIPIRKPTEIKFENEKISDENEVDFVNMFDNRVLEKLRNKKTLQLNEKGRQPAVQTNQEDIMTPTSAVQYQNLNLRKLNPQKYQSKDAPSDWPNPELTEH